MQIRIPQYRIFSTEHELQVFVETYQDRYEFFTAQEYTFNGKAIGDYTPRITRYIAEFYRRNTNDTEN